MNAKQPWKSKTLWVNFLLAGTVLFVPGAEAWLSENPAVGAVVGTVVNALLRLITKDPVSVKPAAQPKEEGQS